MTAAIACREVQPPTGDPKTPPNSPIPDIDRKERDPMTDPKTPPSIGDGG
jgi:hypothetical protein